MTPKRETTPGRSRVSLNECLARLAALEDLARQNQRELEIQFRRMAQIQAELDELRQRVQRSRRH